VTFEEAKSVFLDELAIEFFDNTHSTDQDRFLMLGRSWKNRVLLVCHCVRDNDEVIRIISARKATRNERKYYQG
jgi:uncharacterized DUF497 family protein